MKWRLFWPRVLTLVMGFGFMPLAQAQAMWPGNSVACQAKMAFIFPVHTLHSKDDTL
jgi:hypothetical protein